MAVCDSIGNYILYETGSTQPTRTWARAETSGTDTTGPRVLEKLKYTVLKNPPSTVHGPPKSCLTTSTTIQVGGRLYAIDPAIYAPLVASLQANPVSTLEQLQARIAEVRVQTNLPPPLAVQLANTALSQYKKRYTYKSTDTPLKANVERTEFDFSYLTGDILDLTQVQIVRFIVQQLQIRYPDYFFAPPQYVSVVRNGGCFTGNTKIQDMYPGRSADRFGTPLLSYDNLLGFRRGQPPAIFKNVFVFFHPGSNRANGGKFRARAGILLGFDTSVTTYPPSFEAILAENSELVFVPVMSNLEKITQIDYPSGMGLTLRAVDGRSDNTFEQFDEFVAKLNVGMANNKTLSFTP